MDITLSVTHSEKNKLEKVLTDSQVFTGTLRGITSVISPEIDLEIENPTGFNYAYIPDFGRYYFISDMVSIRSGLWKISMRVDVLMSFKSDILNSQGIIVDTESVNADVYQIHDSWNTKVKCKTDIIPFASGLLESGEYILITAGG